MLCPVCKIPLLLSERQGIEIDYCGQCRGVWLDRGELDKILERNQVETGTPAMARVDPRPDARPDPRHDPRYDPRHDDAGKGKHDPNYRRRKRSFLSDLLDFD